MSEYSDQQQHALEDYIEASLMLQYTVKTFEPYFGHLSCMPI